MTFMKIDMSMSCTSTHTPIGSWRLYGQLTVQILGTDDAEIITCDCAGIILSQTTQYIH